MRPTLKPFLTCKTNDRITQRFKTVFPKEHTTELHLHTTEQKSTQPNQNTQPSLQNKTPLLRESTILVRALIYVFAKSTDTVCVIFHCESRHIGKIN